MSLWCLKARSYRWLKVLLIDLLLESFDPGDLLFESKDETSTLEDRPDSDSDGSQEKRWQQPVHYVYDAAAERTQQRIREGHVLVLNGVH